MRATTLARGLAVVLLAGCFDPGSRWDTSTTTSTTTTTTTPPPVTCQTGTMRCALGKIERCEGAGSAASWTTVEDCAAEGKVCASSLFQCTNCIPNEGTCQGQEAMRCRADGSGTDAVATCDPTHGEACRDGICVDLCQQATTEHSNVGCEYWGVDLDNAMIDPTSNAAAQQFAVVVSNAQPDVAVRVRIFQDDGAPGDPPAPYEIQSAVIAPYNLQVFKLGPREVDGSAPGQYNTGTHTALTRHAYKIVTDFPVVAYQFNPLDNVNVFSNDASLLKPREALGSDKPGMETTYVVAGWPQTIAATDDPNTNFNPADPIHLRAFLTIVGTAEDTTVRVHPKTMVVGGGPVAQTLAGGIIEVKLGAFDVLNLETGDFNADFTGTTIESDQAVVVFSGSEASDAPHFDVLANRRCCADHLEDQLDPLRTAGRYFAVAHNPSRTAAVKAAGGVLDVVPEPDFVRFVSATDGAVEIVTTLPAPHDKIHLDYLGDMAELTVYGDFMAQASGAVLVAQVMASQDAAGVKRGLPGGDPSLLIYPPTEQLRQHYVFLTPDKYAFDFVVLVTSPEAQLTLDGTAPADLGCTSAPADGLTAAQRGSATPPLVVYTCQLSFPVIDPNKTAPDNLTPGMQNDGVHRVDSDTPVAVIVSGFDSYVSYAYAGGTELHTINVPK